MKRLFPFFIFIGFVFISIAVAAENDSSGFVGTWGGVFTSPTNTRVRNAAVMKIDSDSEGKIFLRRYELGGSVVSPPTESCRPGARIINFGDQIRLDDQTHIGDKRFDQGKIG